ncbi:MAG: hypothetical protein ACYDH9_24150 [Limisphaerales bacterium]
MARLLAAYSQATQYLRSKDLWWGDRYQIIVQRDDQYQAWSFTFYFIPMFYGNDCTVTVFDGGKVSYSHAK